MKKLLTLALAAMAAGSAWAEEPNITVLEGGLMYGGLMPQCISNNGTYVGGSTFAMPMFMADWRLQETWILNEDTGSTYEDYGAEIKWTTDDGKGYGFDDNGAVMIDFNTKEYNVFCPIGKDGVGDAMATSATEDGTIIVGYVKQGMRPVTAAYWEDGKINYLPIPSDKELGFTTQGESVARAISNDGKIIIGYVYDKLSTYPMVIWTRQDDGSYICDPVCARYFGEPHSDKEFLKFAPLSITPDGKTVLMEVQYNTDSPELLGENCLAYFDVETENLDVAYIDGENGIPVGTRLQTLNKSISNNGTVVGYYESNEGRGAFIMTRAEMQPKSFYYEFPGIDEFYTFYDNGENVASSITADGRYITGMGWDTKAGYVGYVLDRGIDDYTGVNVIETETAGSMEEAIYTIDGRRVNQPVQGINIIKGTDGKTRKILVK